MHTIITRPPVDVTSPQWLENATNEQHHALKCISSSQLKFIAEENSMYSYHQKYVLRLVKREFKEEFKVGTIAHLAVLEPEVFEKVVKVCEHSTNTNKFKEFVKNNLNIDPKQTTQEEIDLFDKIKALNVELTEADTKEQTKVIKDKIKKTQKQLEEIIEAKDDFAITYGKNGGILDSKGEEYYFVKPEEMLMYKTFQQKIQDHPRLSVYFNDVIVEQTGVAQDPETGLWLSLRGDARNDSLGYFLDPKTIAGPLTKKNITYYCTNFHLALQQAHYIETANLIHPGKYKKFFFVMLSKTQPYEIALVALDDYDVKKAVEKRRQILNKIAQCELTGKWPTIDYYEEYHDYGLKIKLPEWSYR